jgi:hypothetical protein
MVQAAQSKKSRHKVEAVGKEQGNTLTFTDRHTMEYCSQRDDSLFKFRIADRCVTPYKWRSADHFHGSHVETIRRLFSLSFQRLPTQDRNGRFIFRRPFSCLGASCW